MAACQLGHRQAAGHIGALGGGAIQLPGKAGAQVNNGLRCSEILRQAQAGQIQVALHRLQALALPAQGIDLLAQGGELAVRLAQYRQNVMVMG